MTQTQWTHPWDEYTLDLTPPCQSFQPWEDQPQLEDYQLREEGEGVTGSKSGQSLVIIADRKSL